MSICVTGKQFSPRYDAAEYIVQSEAVLFTEGIILKKKNRVVLDDPKMIMTFNILLQIG